MGTSDTVRIGIIIGSTRPGRNAEQVARWVHETATQRDDATFELIDLADHPLPHLDEPVPPARQVYEHDHTRRWAATIAGFDGFVMITPEYNHSTSGVLKNALDYLFHEWVNKAVGFVSYGGTGGVRAVEHLRLICGELAMADVRAQVALTFANDFEHYTTLKPTDRATATLGTMLGEVIAWTTALAPLRATAG